MMKKKHNNIILASVVAVTAIWFFVTWKLYDNNRSSDYQNSFASYGTFIAGTLGVIFSAANVYFLLYIWNKQKQESEKQSIESRFFNLLAMRKEMRNEIRQFKETRAVANVRTEKIFGQERGNEAINGLASSYDGIQLNTKPEQVKHTLQQLYAINSEYLRHYFDFVLYIMEYVDGKEFLSDKEKLDYIGVLKADSTYNEMLLWKLMLVDYADDPKIRQDVRLKRLDDKYKLFEGRVYDI